MQAWLQQASKDFPRLVALTLVGLLLGVMGYTFIYAKGYSYLTNDPAACINCHVMNDQYNGWIKSSHRDAATCNDCHTPSGAVGKYVTKGLNGFWHSFYFTTGNFPEPIRIKPRNARIANDSCLKCHGDLVQEIGGAGPHSQARDQSCTHCHGSVGHRRQ